MKIAINLTREYVGGITTSNLNVISHLYGLNYEFTGIEISSRMYMKGPALFRSFAPEIFDHHIINLHHLPILDVLKRSQTLKDVENAYREPLKIIRKILKDIKPDVVLLSGTHYAPWLISIAAKREGIPIVLWYAGILSKEITSQPKRIKNLFSSMEKTIARRATKIIFPSKLCKDVVEKEVVKGKIKNGAVIPNPVANIFTEPSATEYSLEHKIAAIGRYSKIKNFDKFFELHQELLKRNWNHTATFITNPDAKFKNLPKTINLLPPMTPEGLKNFYLAQGLIVCPSTFETFGNVPMEAACLGIPVIVSENMGCTEVLKQVELTNMVISFDDIAKVADRVQELCDQEILPKQLNALKQVLDNRFVSEEIKAVISAAYKNKNGKNGKPAPNVI